MDIATSTFLIPHGTTSLTAFAFCNLHGLFVGPTVFVGMDSSDNNSSISSSVVISNNTANDNSLDEHSDNVDMTVSASSDDSHDDCNDYDDKSGAFSIHEKISLLTV